MSNKKQNVSLPAGEVDFGTLLVGDSNGNDAVNGGDVSYLVPSFLLCSGDASYRSYADTNKDGCVNGADVSALIPNFLKAGPILASTLDEAAAGSRARIKASPCRRGQPALDSRLRLVERRHLRPGRSWPTPGTGSADTVDAYIDFDPTIWR